ncbi:MAG: CopG family transcriptional regulator [Nitrospirae bacterium]|nr:CopG family transcriptional regulator [Candidatus Manganitrophaceae bacterium]
MKKQIKYTDEPLEKFKTVADFLPPPSELIFKEDMVKVTISLSKSSIEFFKQEASTHHTQYQKMIRNLLDRYSAHYRTETQSSDTGGNPKHNIA